MWQFIEAEGERNQMLPGCSFNIQYTVYSILYTVYTVYYTLYTLYSIQYSTLSIVYRTFMRRGVAGKSLEGSL